MSFNSNVNNGKVQSEPLYKKDFGGSGNIPVFDSNGFIVDSNFQISGITASTINVNNGLSYNTGSTLGLGGKLQKYKTYIFADPSNTPFPSGIPSSIHFGASGQTSTPTGGTTLINNYPLGSVNMVLSGSSVFGDNIPKVGTVNFNYSDTSIHQSTADGISYTDYVQLNDSINISSFNTTGAQGASINISSTSGGDANVNMIAGLSSGNVGLTTVDFNYNDGIAIARSITLNDSGTVISNVNGANISGFRMYDTGTTYYNNNGGFAIANNLAVSQVPKAIGVSSFAMGNYTEARATGSFAAGLGSSATNKRLIATGATSFNFSENNASQTVNHGALAANSFILGGVNHNVPNTSPRSGIIGGSAIKVVGSVTDTVHMPKVRIGLGTGGQIPTTLITGSTMIGRNSTNGELSSIRVGNGVTFTNGMLKLGGVISGATSIGLIANNLTITATTGTLRYGGDYSANYNVRSIVDKGFVTGITSTLSITANNGLTKNGSNVRLGGSLTGNTSINTTGGTEMLLLRGNGSIVNTQNGLTTQSNTNSFSLVNTTAAAAGVQQYSPSIFLEGQGWKTGATAASQSVRVAQWLSPVQGSTNPFFDYNFGYSINNAPYTQLMKFQYGNVNLSHLGQGSIYIGTESATALTTGFNNTFVGNHAARVLTTGYQNTSLGSRTAVSLTTGYENTFVGQGAGYFINTGHGNVLMGFHSGLNLSTANDNTLIGNSTGQGSGTPANNTATNNVAVGSGSLGSATMTTASRNTLVGNETGVAITTANNNSMFGYQTGIRVTTGVSNALFGYQVGQFITTTNYNCFYGNQAGQNATGTGSIMIGAAAGAASTSADFNTFIGYLAADDNTTGDRNIAIGSDVRLPSTTASNQLVIQNIIYGTNNSGTAGTISTGQIGIGTKTPQAKLQVEETTLGNEVFRISSVATNDDPEIRVFQNKVTTTTSGTTTLHTFATASNRRYFIEVIVIGMRISGSSGTSGDTGYYKANAQVKNVGGTVTISGSNTSVEVEDQSSWGISWSVSGTNVLLRVNGAQNNGITWTLVKGEVNVAGT